MNWNGVRIILESLSDLPRNTQQRPIKAYGLDRMRALMALCAWIEGVPMLYQGDENPAVYGGKGASSVEFLRKIHGLRKSIPALQHNDTDYISATATEGVFACIRQAPRQKALILISFNPKAITTKISTSLAGTTWKDEFSGETLPRQTPWLIPMAPCQPRLLTCP